MDFDDPLTTFMTYHVLDYLTREDGGSGNEGRKDNRDRDNDREEDRDDDGVTPLMRAAAEGSVRKVKRLIAREANVIAGNKWGATFSLPPRRISLSPYVNARNKWGATALMYAVLSGSVEVARILIENGANINAKNNDGITALMHAVARRNRAMVKLLLENGADVSIKDKKGNTALSYASKNINIEEIGGKTVSYPVDKDIIKLLLDNGADIDAKNDMDKTATLMDAVKAGDKDMAKFLLENGADVNAKANGGVTALRYAVYRGNKDMAKFLLERGADVNAKDNGGITALMLAAVRQDKDMAKFLLERGADVNAKDNDGITALRYAVEQGNKDMAKFLIENGADIDAKDNNGITALRYAVEQGNIEMAKFLLENGADVNAKNKWGATALMYAARSGSVKVARIWIENGADIDAKNKWGATALRYAVEQGNIEMAKFLLENGADVNAKDNNGETPLMWAAMQRNRAMIKLLLEHGADVSIKDKDGDTALSYASKNMNIRYSGGKTVSYPVDKGIIDLLEKAQQEEAAKEEERKAIKPIIEKFNNRYVTIEQKMEHIPDLTNLINHKLNKEYTDRDTKEFLRYFEKEQNIELLDKEISKLEYKSQDNIAKTLIKLAPETNFEKEEDYRPLFEQLCEYLYRKGIAYQVDGLKESIRKEYKLLKAKQFEEKLSRDLDKRITAEEIEHLNGFEFEERIGELFRKAGYKVTVTKKSGDQGADLIVEKDGVSTAIQTKKYAGSVGNAAVQEVVAAMKYYDCDKAMVITTGSFTKEAYELASRNGVQLIDKKGLDDLFDKVL